MKTLPKILALSALLLAPVQSAQAALITFNYTGAKQTWVVPDQVSMVTIRAWGAQGQSNAGGIVGGLGGFVGGDLAVNAGDLLNIFIGGGGQQTVTGGFNGGGNAGDVGAASAFGGGGGGATDIRIGGESLLDRVFVAAGGGGAGGNRVAGQGRGTGGGGGAGYYGGGGGAAWPYQSLTLPSGGTQTQGGNGGTSSYGSAPNNNGQAGTLGLGGNGGDEVLSTQADSGTAQTGGAGGGLVGSSGNYVVNWTGQSGAGGSSYAGFLTNLEMLAGVRVGNGLLEIQYELDEVTTPASAPGAFALLLLSLMMTLGRRVRSS